ncbi:U1 small nuclear ribonucleoprotein [Chionoecetes opilio]|uniref:U1 small nuclear ribonucleoprotein 70 kDa n=1 Tax=Chionoecetes opilio TaxID=41210 RepID=A0A8J5D2N5_CHIOP|nr:U1 small nuclear ribonucleoprotein [Chionoecetes opilio]
MVRSDLGVASMRPVARQCATPLRRGTWHGNVPRHSGVARGTAMCHATQAWHVARQCGTPLRRGTWPGNVARHSGVARGTAMWHATQAWHVARQCGTPLRRGTWPGNVPRHSGVARGPAMCHATQAWHVALQCATPLRRESRSSVLASMLTLPMSTHGSRFVCVVSPTQEQAMTSVVVKAAASRRALISLIHNSGSSFSAYKHADGKKIDNRRVLVDVERARTVKGWLPRRLGGGLGGTRRGGPDVNIKHSGREDDRRRAGAREEERLPRDRKRRRSRSRDRAAVPEEGDEREKEKEKEKEKRPRHRSRSRDRKRRSKSRERKHRRDRGDRERRERGPGEEGEEGIKIKQEPEDDYPDYSGTYYNNFPMKEEDERLLAKNGTKYEEEEEEQPNNEIDY